MKLEIVTPEGVLYSGEVTLVTLPGINGSFTLLERHAPLISALGKGKLLILDEENQEKEYYISGGFAEVKNNTINVCLEEVIDEKDEE